MKNILHLESSLGWGGQEIRTLKEAIGLKKRGYNVFFATNKNANLAKRAKKAGFEVFIINYKKAFWIKTFFSLINIIKKNKIDLIISHSSEDAWIGGGVAKFLKIPILRMRHLSTKVKKGLNSKILYNYLADFIICTCQDAALKIAKQSGKNEKFCISIPTGVEENIFVDHQKVKIFKKEYNLSNYFLVGTMCFMRSWKGVDDFLYAADLLKNDKDIKFIIIGKGHDEKYKNLAKKLNLQNVIFTGHLEDPFSVLFSLDIFLLLSTAHEGVSQASLQAAFLEKPLITTSVGGLKEICIDGKSGFIVNPFSPKEVVEKILLLKKDREKRLLFGKNAKKIVLKKFTFEKMLDQIERAYQTLQKNKD